MQYVNVVLFTALAFVCLRTAQRHRTASGWWAAVTFGVLGAVSLFGLLLGDDNESMWAVKVLLLGILVYPYALYRFAASFERLPRRTDMVVTGLSLLAAAATLFLPDDLPGEDAGFGDWPGWLWVYLVVLLVDWVGIGFLVARRLWRAGRDFGRVTRYRMRTLSVGAVLLALALVPGLSDAIPFLSSLGALMFFVGLAPPGWLRSMWRRKDETALRTIELDLIRADSRDAVMATVLPHAAALVGGNTASFVEGKDLLATSVSAASIEEATMDESTVRLPVAGGQLVVEAGAYAPFFGDDEFHMLRSLATFVDLVLARMALLESERIARTSAQRTSAELETLVYGISHDLKSPVISLLGYIEYMREDHSEHLDEEALHYLSRMEKSAVYMQALLADLLELSRVGRVAVEAEDVDLTELVEDVRIDVVSKFPQVEVTTSDLPTVRMNRSRARQLFTNLIENAANHGGRPDITIRAFANLRDDGSVVVSVVDDGVGIAPEYRDRAFGIFERLAPRESGTGTGIGLALCRKIVETAGGTIDIADSAVGTHVRINLPATAVRTTRRPTAEVSR